MSEKKLTIFWLKAFQLPAEFLGTENPDWMFGRNDAISLVKTNEHELPVIRLSEHEHALASAVEEATRVALIAAFNACAGQKLDGGGDTMAYDHAVDVCASAIARLQIKHARATRAAQPSAVEESK